MRGLALVAVLAISMGGIDVAAAMAPVADSSAGPSLEPDVETWPGIEATVADEINAYLMQGLSRERLTKLYPNLPELEMETLMHRVERFAKERPVPH